MSPQDPIAPYAGVHKSPRGPGDARPTAMHIIQVEDLIGKWTDKTVLITGGSSGIGVETARALHATGARVFITARDFAKAEAVRKDILSTSPSQAEIEIVEMELGSLESVRNGAKQFLRRSERLNILVNNAGIMATPLGRTKDGFENQFGTNHLSHFLLTKLLLPTLQASSRPDFASRVVNLSSAGHHYAVGGLTPEVLADLDFSTSEYQKWVAYGRSKTANILHANHIERLYGSNPKYPVHGFSLHPGGVTTELWRHLGGKDPSDDYHNIWKSVKQGAATSVWCATAQIWEGKPGRFCENCQESPPDLPNAKPGDLGYAPWAYDEDAEISLWEVSERMVGSSV